MKIDTKLKLYNFEGEVLLFPINDTTKEEVTIGNALRRCIFTNKEKGLIDHAKSFEMAQKIFSSDVVDLDTSDVDILKKIVGKNEIYGSLVLGQILLYLRELELKKDESK